MRQTRASYRRKQILDAASRIFADAGYEAARVDDIARTAGIGKGTVYEYFESKQDLFEQLLSSAFTEHLQMLQRALSGHDDLGALLQAGLEATFQFVADHRPLARVLNEHPTGGPSVAFRQQVMEIHQQVTELVQTVIARKLAEQAPHAKTNVALATQIYLGAMKELAFTRLLAQDVSDDHQQPPPAALAKATAELLVNGFINHAHKTC